MFYLSNTLSILLYWCQYKILILCNDPYYFFCCIWFVYLYLWTVKFKQVEPSAVFYTKNMYQKKMIQFIIIIIKELGKSTKHFSVYLTDLLISSKYVCWITQNPNEAALFISHLPLVHFPVEKKLKWERKPFFTAMTYKASSKQIMLFFS